MPDLKSVISVSKIAMVFFVQRFSFFFSCLLTAGTVKVSEKEDTSPEIKSQTAVSQKKRRFPIASPLLEVITMS